MFGVIRILRLNPSLNADVPHAWAGTLRIGPPISQFR